MADVTTQNEATSLEVKNNPMLSYAELEQMVVSFQDQLQSLDYRVTNKNFGSKIYQTKETINSKSRFVAGAKDDIAIMDAQHPTYRLWIGAEDPTTAPFKVDKLGNATLASVTLSGYLQIGEALTDIGAGNITSTYLGTNSVTTDKIVANAVTAAKINVGDLFAQNITATGTITGLKIVGGTITGGTVQTDSSGLRTVLGDGTDSIKFMNGSTIYGSITPYVFAGGNGMAMETLAGDAFLYLQEGTTDSVSIGVTGASISISATEIAISQDLNFYNNNLVDCGNITANDVTSDIGSATTQFDNLYIDDIFCDNDITITDGCLIVTAGFVRLAQMSGATADARSDDLIDGNMYYRTDDDVIRVRINGAWKTITVS